MEEVWGYGISCENLRNLIKSWNKETFGNIDNNIAKLESEVALVEKNMEDKRANDLMLNIHSFSA